MCCQCKVSGRRVAVLHVAIHAEHGTPVILARMPYASVLIGQVWQLLALWRIPDPAHTNINWSCCTTRWSHRHSINGKHWSRCPAHTNKMSCKTKWLSCASNARLLSKRIPGMRFVSAHKGPEHAPAIMGFHRCADHAVQCSPSIRATWALTEQHRNAVKFHRCCTTVQPPNQSRSMAKFAPRLMPGTRRSR